MTTTMAGAGAGAGAAGRRRRRGRAPPSTASLPPSPAAPCSSGSAVALRLGCSVLGLCCCAASASAFQPPPLPPSAASLLQQQRGAAAERPLGVGAAPPPPLQHRPHSSSSSSRSSWPAAAAAAAAAARPAPSSALFSSFASSSDASSSFGFELEELLGSGVGGVGGSGGNARAIPLGLSLNAEAGGSSSGATTWRELVLTGPSAPSRQQLRRPPARTTPRAAPEPEAWRASKEESQAMQALILRAQADPWEMLRLLRENPAGCNHVNACTVLHRCGKLAERLTPEARAAVAQQLLPVMHQILPACRGRQLCNVAWALARLGMPDPRLFDATIERLQAPGGRQGQLLLEGCNAGELAMAMWAVASAGLTARHAGFFELAAEPLADKAAGLRPREIGLITWAYATWLQHDLKQQPQTAPPAASLEAAAAAASGRKWLVKPLVTLLEATLHCEAQLQAKDIAMLAWAFGKLCPLDWNALGPHVDMLCATLASSALKSIRHFTAQDLAELAVGVVAMQYDNANLMQLVACEAAKKLRLFSHRELANIIWAFGKVFRRPRRFVLAAAKEARARLPHFSPTELANVAWALTALEVYDVGFFQDAFARMQASLGEGALQEGDLNQLYQVYSLLRLQAPEAVAGVGPPLRRAMEAAWAASKEREKRTTNRQAAVAKVLENLRVRHEVEAEHDIDILLPDDGVALEVDGPAHFLRNTGHPMGHTIMKRRLLELMGYRVVSVPHFEWDRIPYWSSMELKRYLQRKMETTEVLQFSAVDSSSLKPFPPRGKKTRFD